MIAIALTLLNLLLKPLTVELSRTNMSPLLRRLLIKIAQIVFHLLCPFFWVSLFCQNICKCLLSLSNFWVLICGLRSILRIHY